MSGDALAGFCCWVIFFFSSRRRHTRLVSDWSSDVCSSDHGAVLDAAAVHLVEKRPQDARAGGADGMTDGDGPAVDVDLFGVQLAELDDREGDGRSEERRVGKESGARWSAAEETHTVIQRPA